MLSYNEFQRVTHGVFRECPRMSTITSDDLGLRTQFHRAEHFDMTDVLARSKDGVDKAAFASEVATRLSV